MILVLSCFRARCYVDGVNTGHENSTPPIDLTSDYSCKTSENVEIYNAFFLFLLNPMICRTSSDFDNLLPQSKEVLDLSRANLFTVIFSI